MSYDVSYSSLPTLNSQSIGYNVNKASIFSTANNTALINVCNFSLGIGVYILTVNIAGLVSVTTNNFWYGGISDTSSVTFPQIYLASSSQSIYVSNPYYTSGINFTHIINNTSASTIYVQIKSYNAPGYVSDPDYNCSIVRIT
jgi:hypothetical protein